MGAVQVGRMSGVNTLLKYTLSGKVVPKARPRFGGGRAFLPQRYRDWKDNALAELLSQSCPPIPISKAEVSIDLFGGHRGDLDNLAGSVQRCPSSDWDTVRRQLECGF